MIQLLSTAAFAVMSLGATPTKSRPYDVQHYQLEVRQSNGATFSNTARVTFKALSVLSEIELDAYRLQVKAVNVDGQTYDFALKSFDEAGKGTLTVKLKKPIAKGQLTVVQVDYDVTAGAANRGFFVATESDVAQALPGYFTHFEPTYAQRFFPLNDSPADKATSEVLVEIDARYQVVSNGKKLKDETFVQASKNVRRVHWKQEQEHSPYLIAVAMAPFEQVKVNEDIPSTIWVPPGMKDSAFVAADALKGLFDFQQKFTGTKFPFSKLDVVAVPNFNFGGMENTSAIFERTSRLLVSTKNDQLARSKIVSLLSHEMAHQYFGDLVTCKSWDEIWLNEGFATYLGDLAWDDYNDHEESEVSRAVSLAEDYFREEDGPHSHPLVVKGIPAEDAFDSTSYTKGAMVLRMLEAWVSKPEMKKILKVYLEKNAFKAVTSDDFFNAVFEVARGEKELKSFKDAWLYKKGYPILFPETSYAGGKLTITIRQQPNQASEKGAFAFKLPIVIHRENEPAFHREEVITITKPQTQVVIEVPAAPQWVNWNRNFGALVKISPDAVSQSQRVDAARLDPDPVWRLLSTFSMLGELGKSSIKEEVMPADAEVGAIMDVLVKDPSPYVREAVLHRLAATRFKRLPVEFAGPLLSLSKRPEGLQEDPPGYIRVRNAAMGALGRVDSPEGHRWLLEQLAIKDVDINYLSGLSESAARIGSPAALGQLSATMTAQKSRTSGHYAKAIIALGTSTSVDVIPLIRAVLESNPTNNEIFLSATSRLEKNKELRETREFADLVRDIVLDEKRFNQELRERFLGSLDDVTYEPAKQALTDIAARTSSQSIKLQAQRSLAANFPKASVPPVKKK
jgi:aminopeptidase N